MPDIGPSPAVIKIGSIVVIAVIAFAAIYAANNVTWLNKTLSKKAV